MYSCVDCLLVILRFLCNNSLCSARSYHCTVLNNNSVCVNSEKRLTANPIYKNTTVGTSKPALEERFDVRADILILSDKDCKPIVSQRREHNKIIALKSKGYGHNLIDQQ